MPQKSKKSAIEQVIVMSQLGGPQGNQSCGYHTLKNLLLTLLYFQGTLNQKKWQELLKDNAFFTAFFEATKKTPDDNGHLDLTLPNFIDLLQKVKAGQYDFTRWGVTRQHLIDLPIQFDGSENITVANYHLKPGAAAHGLGGMTQDLFTAAMAAKLKRTQGEAHHVFALGINDAHWVMAGLHINARGERRWYFMDSYGNQSRYKESVISKIEAVLDKTEHEMRAYLVAAYRNALLNFNVLIKRYLNDDFTVKLDAAWYTDLIENKKFLASCVLEIEGRFNFMNSVGWLSPSINKTEQSYLNTLYHWSKFLHDGAEEADVDVKRRLKSVYEALEPYQGVALASEDEAFDEAVELQAQTCIDAVNTGAPKPTEGFVSRIVNVIYAILEGVKNAIFYIGQSIGLVK